MNRSLWAHNQGSESVTMNDDPDDHYYDDDEETCMICGGSLHDMADGELCSKCHFLTWECGMGPDGQCSLAGTEDCDWHCPRGL